MKKAIKFALFALLPMVFVGCTDPQDVAEDWIDAMLDNDKEEIKALADKDSQDRMVEMAAKIAKGEELYVRYMLENADDLETIFETDVCAVVAFSGKVPAAFEIEKCGDDLWLPDDLRLVRPSAFKGSVAKAYLEDDSDAEIYGEDAVDVLEDMVMDIDNVLDLALDLAEEEMEKLPKPLAEVMEKNLKIGAFEEGAKKSLEYFKYVRQMDFETVEEMFDAIEVIHEEGDGPNTRKCYVTIDAPRAGVLLLKKNVEGKWQVIDVEDDWVL